MKYNLIYSRREQPVDRALLVECKLMISSMRGLLGGKTKKDKKETHVHVLFFA